MRISGRCIGMVALALLAAGCGERGVTGAGYRADASPHAPRPTGQTSSTVATVSGTADAAGAGSTTIRAASGGVTGSPSVPGMSATSSGTLSVSISGPGVIRPNLYCNWFGFVSGGTGSYTFSWTQTSGTGFASVNEYTTKSWHAFGLTLNVTDSNGATGSATMNVYIDSRAALCA